MTGMLARRLRRALVLVAPLAAAVIALASAAALTPASAQPIEIRPDLRPVIRPDVLPQTLPRVCAPPRVMRNGRCVNPDRPGPVVVCRPPQVSRNGRCVDPIRPPVVCIPPKVVRNGRCVDPVRPPVVCAPPRVMSGGRCIMPPPRPIVCPPPKIRVNGRCVEPVRPIACVPPRVRRGDRCVLPSPMPVVCPAPRIRVNGRCVLPDVRPSCRLPYVWSRAARRCILPVPVPPAVRPQTCNPPWRYSAEAGGCICPSGHVVDDGACVRRDSQACSYPFVWSGSAGRCVCAQGFRPYGAGCAPERPAPSPQDNVLWIQSCLNAAGYDAGPEDGLAGRRTRSAWDDFRADQGLDGATAPYTDPETLAKLFAACQPEDAAASQPGAADTAGGAPATNGTAAPNGDADASRPEGDANAGDDGVFTPASAQCATGRLYTLLSAENADIEPCGRACIPAPEGLSEEELAARADAQGITWCRSCITVDDLGMLCPLPEENGDAAGSEGKAETTR